MGSRVVSTEVSSRRRYSLTLLAVHVLGCASPLKDVRSSEQFADTSLVELPGISVVRQTPADWSTSLEQVEMRGSQKWRAYGVVSLSRVGQLLVVVDFLNNQLLVLRERDGTVRGVVGALGQSATDFDGPSWAGVVGQHLIVWDRGNSRLRMFDGDLMPRGIATVGQAPFMYRASAGRLYSVRRVDTSWLLLEHRCCPPDSNTLGGFSVLLSEPPYDVAVSGRATVAAILPPDRLAIFEGRKGHPRRLVRFHEHREPQNLVSASADGEVRPISWTALTASSCVHPCGRSPLK